MQVCSIKGNLASTEWILAGQELDQCRLARAIVPDQADNSPCWQTYCQWFEQNPSSD
jgi:hypothetical protein